MSKWAQKGEIPIDANFIKVRGGGNIQKQINYLNEVADTAANRFI